MPEKLDKIDAAMDRVRARIESLIRRFPEKDDVRLFLLEKSKFAANPEVRVEIQRLQRTESGRSHWSSCYAHVSCELSILKGGVIRMAPQYNITLLGWHENVEPVLALFPSLIRVGEEMDRLTRGKEYAP